MNERKQHVIKAAHQLFIEKGFQATSIQDILDYSGISKGTFYNYFSSKNELLLALFKSILENTEKERNELLIGQDPADIKIFIKQVELHLITNRRKRLITLFEEVLVSNDEDLKQFMRIGQVKVLRWLYKRFIQIFGKEKQPYLLDCAIMFMGILHNNLKYNARANGSIINYHQIVRYSVDRIAGIVKEVAEAGDQLIQPELLESWLPESNSANPAFRQRLRSIVLSVKKKLSNCGDQFRYVELLNFIEEELLHSKTPRMFLIESALSSLKAGNLDISELEQIVHSLSSETK
ncbi:TetR/AcrR family transcriptional regulator [Peribacillus saganii]|uniref:TetR/AcrR family transcriptional regulator n=1 Tax=Peribacillus saganii TaxID=2303992 RepID=A0A372LJR6_9BACI|nr:TetR/AcrR family transcriptional regulator [Peribacillus saganii]RFU66371.1 TetR/AcrR family transcriptional regulator [Peribacillus saganii]